MILRTRRDDDLNVCVSDAVTRYAAGRPGSAVPGQRLPVVDADGKMIGVVSETGMLTKRALDLAGRRWPANTPGKNRGNQVAARRVT